MSVKELLEAILRRLVRLETRVAKLMEYEGVSPYKATKD